MPRIKLRSNMERPLLPEEVLGVGEPYIEDNKIYLGNGVDSKDNLPIAGGGGGLAGTNYVFVQGNGTPEENAAELQGAYNKAKTMPRYLGTLYIERPVSIKKEQTYYLYDDEKYYRSLIDFEGEEQNMPEEGAKIEITEAEAKSGKMTVVVAPGNYDFGATAFVIDAPYIDVVSLTGNADVMLSSSQYSSASDTYIGIKVISDNVLLKGLNCGDHCLYIQTSNLTSLICENCVGGPCSFGHTDIAIPGTFNNCVGGHYSFGNYNGIVSGTFTNCKGGDQSFGGGGGTASGTFTDCVGGEESFGGFGTASGTFTDCVGEKYAFGCEGIASGTFTNCVGGNGSFGGSGGTVASTARLYYCKLGSGSFPTPVAGGKLVLCIDGNDSIVTTA